ncbi:MAG: hypothetical protein IT379_39250 [Deltaproteobacteria bacterium]|nr:hypothetical protein [Deltaproteobacteria bacterium]
MAFFAVATTVGAQTRRCVEETTPPATAGEEAECFFARRAYADAARWCVRADLSDEAMGNLCFTAHVRAGRFEDAARVAGTLDRVRPAARACHAAFTTGLRVRVVPNPSSGVVTVDGDSYGRGAAEVLLAPPFWDHRVEARFGRESVRVAEPRLRRALDRESCAARDVVVEAQGRETGGSDGAPVGGIVLVATGGVAAITGIVFLAVGEDYASDVSDAPPGPFDDDLRTKQELADPFRWTGAISLGCGVLAGLVGVALLVDLFGADDNDPGHVAADLYPGGIRLRSSF